MKFSKQKHSSFVASRLYAFYLRHIVPHWIRMYPWMLNSSYHPDLRRTYRFLSKWVRVTERVSWGRVLTFAYLKSLLYHAILLLRNLGWVITLVTLSICQCVSHKVCGQWCFHTTDSHKICEYNLSRWWQRWPIFYIFENDTQIVKLLLAGFRRRQSYMKFSKFICEDFQPCFDNYILHCI